MRVEIRRARPDDAGFLAWVTLCASRSQLKRGIWDLIIGADEDACLDYLSRLVVAEPRSIFHYENALVAEAEGQPAAALSGFEMHADVWRILAEAMSAVQRDLGWSGADFEASRQRSAPLWACFPEEVGADWVIESVATRPEHRGRSLATALLDEVVRDGIRRGRRLAQITTYIGNDFARSVYEKAGFQHSGEKRCPELEPILGLQGFVRLLRRL